MPKLETGTWEPTVLSGGSGWASGTPEAYYQKYGAIVTITLMGWDTTISDPTSDVLYISLPFRVANTRYGVGSSFGFVVGGLRDTKTIPFCINYENNSYLYFTEPATPDSNIIKGDQFGINTWQMSLTYLTDE